MWPSEKLMSLQGSGVVRGGGLSFGCATSMPFRREAAPQSLAG